MIAGLGALTVGGGAVFGSGAFSSTEATRNVQVNVIDESGIAEEFLDVVIDVGAYDSIGIGDASGTPQDETNLFPANGDTDYNQDPGFDGSEVSLIDNDVTIVFGGTSSGDYSDLGGIAANTTVTYDDLFVMVNDDSAGESPDFDVAFDFEKGGANYDLSFDDGGDNQVNVVAGENETLATTELATGSTNETSGELVITITESS